MSKLLIHGSEAEIEATVIKQLHSFYFLNEQERCVVEKELPHALARCERSFSKTKNKYYSKNGETYFNPLHGCQWTRFLYELSRCIYTAGGGGLYATNCIH